MKKLYKKPEIFMESFEVSQFIAGCGNTQTSRKSEQPYEFNGITLFNTGADGNGCDNHPDEFVFSENDKPCYDIPISTFDLVNS